MIRISKTSKLDGIKSWSLQAIDTCPGSKGADGQLVPACSGCYATTGNYVFPDVKAPRVANREDWTRVEWVDDMVRALTKESHFRWFDSGDAYDLRLLRKIAAVIERTPHVRHWLPTRMHKFPKFRATLERIDALPNAVVRYSSDAIDGATVLGAHTSTIVSDHAQIPAGASVCRAYEHGGTCSGCRACWSKSVPIVAYVAHGRKMASVIARAS